MFRSSSSSLHSPWLRWPKRTEVKVLSIIYLFYMYANFVVDVSIEQVAALSSEDALPEPALDLDRIQASNSTFTVPTVPIRQNTLDPWNTAPKYGPAQNPSSALGVGGSGGLTGGSINGAQSSLSGTGLPSEWWKRMEHVRVTILGQQGFILNRYTVYEIMTEVRISCL